MCTCKSANISYIFSTPFTITEIDDKAPNITIKQTYDKNTNTVKVEAISDEILINIDSGNGCAPL